MQTILLRLPLFAGLVAMALTASAQLEGNTNDNPFRQLYDVLPTPNSVRTASGAPGHEYWQQKVDYVMDIRLDDGRQRIDGKETITYINNSPDELRYLWLRLDQNVRDLDSDSHMIEKGFMEDRMTLTASSTSSLISMRVSKVKRSRTLAARPSPTPSTRP